MASIEFVIVSFVQLQWDVCNGLGKLAISLPVPFLRDYCFVILAKINELLDLEVCSRNFRPNYSLILAYNLFVCSLFTL